jgi:hypothetical protein
MGGQATVEPAIVLPMRAFLVLGKACPGLEGLRPGGQGPCREAEGAAITGRGPIHE